MNPIPEHIAIIMDGNGRWALAHGLPREEGHRKGVETVEGIVTACRDLGVRHLTLYAFSDENWCRPQREIDALMRLLAYFVNAKCEKMLSNNIRLRTIGEFDRLPEDAREEVLKVMEKTSHCSGMDLILALSYGSHNELVRAFNRLAGEKKADITPADIDKHLDTSGIPNPDLLIRTSGELRISNFMLWQIAYTELYFTDILWPDFGEEELMKAIDDYRRRERRFGGVGGEAANGHL